MIHQSGLNRNEVEATCMLTLVATRGLATRLDEAQEVNVQARTHQTCQVDLEPSTCDCLIKRLHGDSEPCHLKLDLLTLPPAIKSRDFLRSCWLATPAWRRRPLACIGRSNGGGFDLRVVDHTLYATVAWLHQLLHFRPLHPRDSASNTSFLLRDVRGG